MILNHSPHLLVGEVVVTLSLIHVTGASEPMQFFQGCPPKSYLHSDSLYFPKIIQDSGGGGRVEGDGDCNVDVDDVGGGGVVDDDDHVGLDGVDSDAGGVDLDDVELGGVLGGDDRLGLGGVDSDAGDVDLNVEGGGVGNDRISLSRDEPDGTEGDGSGNVSDLLDRSCCDLSLKNSDSRSGLTLEINGSRAGGVEGNRGLNTVGGVAIII